MFRWRRIGRDVLWAAEAAIQLGHLGRAMRELSALTVPRVDMMSEDLKICRVQIEAK